MVNSCVNKKMGLLKCEALGTAKKLKVSILGENKQPCEGGGCGVGANGVKYQRERAREP